MNRKLSSRIDLKLGLYQFKRFVFSVEEFHRVALCQNRFLYTRADTNITRKTKPFPVIENKIASVGCDESTISKNVKIFEEHLEIYNKAVAISLQGGGEKSIERHVKRHGKMMILDRVKALVDDEHDFIELSLIGGFGMEYGNIPRANFLTGIGKVCGRYCMILANDGSFKGGAIYPISLKKQLRAQEIAKQNRLPCIMLVDSAGAFLPLQADIFIMGGKGFYNEAILSAAKIPQIAIVCGSCTAGGAYIPTMADEAVIVDRIGTIFLAGPPLVQAALGEVIPAEELGGATLHCRTSGCTDYFAKTESEAYETGRDIISSLNLPSSTDIEDYEDPLYSLDDMPSLIPSPSEQHNMNIYQVIARIVDGSRFHEFKAMYGSSLVTGFAYIKGHLVGLIGNQGQIEEPEASKGAHFVQLCNERSVPLIFLQNTAPENTEFNSSNAVTSSITLKAQARMMSAVSVSPVPKLTVVVGNGFGFTHYLMGGRAVNPNFLFAWPNARVAIMEPDSLEEALINSEENGKSEVDEIKRISEINEKIQTQSSAIYGATRIWNDGIILPSETRNVLAKCLSICKAYTNPPKPEYPVLRM